MNIKLVAYEDIPEDERLYTSNNGRGRKEALYIRIEFLDGNKPDVVYCSDAMESEDATFNRDLSWIIPILRRAYKAGKVAI